MVTENQPMFSTIHSTSEYHRERTKPAAQKTAIETQRSIDDLLCQKICSFVLVNLTGMQVGKKEDNLSGQLRLEMRRNLLLDKNASLYTRCLSPLHRTQHRIAIL